MTVATLQNEQQRPVHEKAAIRVGASGALAENQASTKADEATGTMVKHRILQTTPKVLRWKGKKRLKKREKGTEEDGVAVRDTKENASEQESVKDIVATEKRLWELHRLLNNRKESLSSTYKKNTEANTKVYDLNKKTMQAVDVLADHEENDARDRGGRHAVRGSVRGHGGV